MILLQSLLQVNKLNQFLPLESSKLLLFLFVSALKKKMVGSIHPFTLSSRDLPHLPLYDLVWIVWDCHRGDPKHYLSERWRLVPRPNLVKVEARTLHNI